MRAADDPPNPAADLPPPNAAPGLLWSVLVAGAGLALGLMLEANFCLWGVWLIGGLASGARALLRALVWRRPGHWAALGFHLLAPLLAWGVGGSDLPVRLDAWRTREVRERLAPGLLDSGVGDRARPEWTYGSITTIDDHTDNYVFFHRQGRPFGEGGYAYAPAGDVTGCPRGLLAAKQKLGERWLWIVCEE